MASGFKKPIATRNEFTAGKMERDAVEIGDARAFSEAAEVGRDHVP
jgi:hypothetical protein